MATYLGHIQITEEMLHHRCSKLVGGCVQLLLKHPGIAPDDNLPAVKGLSMRSPERAREAH